MKKTEKIQVLTQQNVMATYNRLDLGFKRGKGAYLFDFQNEKYLDFLTGISVTNLGHSHPTIAKVIAKQAKKLLHTSNLYLVENQALLAEKLGKVGLGGKTFFCNSGAEANEAAIKFARYYGNKLAMGKNEIVSLRNSFHGRTLAAVTLTGQEQYQKGFEPLPTAFRHIEANNIAELEEAVTEKTAALFIEVVQGESGVRPLSQAFVNNCREICTKHRALLIVDEVQTGLGRTGKWFGFENYHIKPDAFTLAKGLANGLPMGALHASPEFSDVFTPRSHASTFGGGPLVSAVGLKVLELIENILPEMKNSSESLKNELQSLQKKFSFIKEIRGFGLMLGIGLDIDAQEVNNLCLQEKLLLNAIGNHTLRLLPPFIITKKEIDKAVSRLIKVFKKF